MPDAGRCLLELAALEAQSMTHPIISKLREARIDAGRSLDDLGTAIGIGASMLSHIEMGRREAKFAHIVAAAESLGLRLWVEPLAGPTLTNEQRQLAEMFECALPLLSETELEIWKMELEIRLRQRGLGAKSQTTK